MRLLDRYLFRELLTPFAFCLIGIQSFVIFSTVFSDAGKIQEAKLHFGQTIAYAGAASMEYLTIVMPVSLLLALLMALTHHARHNELTAMRAAGISLWRICTPYLIVGFLLSGALFALNELAVPRCLDFADRMLNRYSGNQRDVVVNFGFQNEREHRLWATKGYYHPGSPDLPAPQVDWMLPDRSSRMLTASRAVYTNGVWTFYNAKVFAYTNGATYSVFLLQTNVLAMPQFDETPHRMRVEIRINNYLNYGHNSNIPLNDVVDYLRWHPDLGKMEKGRLLTELHDRIAMPLTCMVVALIAIPFGAAPGRRNLFVGVAGSISICFVYFVLQRVSLALGSNGVWPPWLAAWLPNLFFILVGLILTARIR